LRVEAVFDKMAIGNKIGAETMGEACASCRVGADAGQEIIMQKNSGL